MSLKSHEIVMKLLYLSYEQMFIVFLRDTTKSTILMIILFMIHCLLVQENLTEQKVCPESCLFLRCRHLFFPQHWPGMCLL